MDILQIFGLNGSEKCSPQQMTLNRNKDHHMFQMVPFKTSVSSNHLPSGKTKNNINEMAFTNFLPCADEHCTCGSLMGGIFLQYHRWKISQPLASAMTLWIRQTEPLCAVNLNPHKYVWVTYWTRDKIFILSFPDLQKKTVLLKMNRIVFPES